LPSFFKKYILFYYKIPETRVIKITPYLTSKLSSALEFPLFLKISNFVKPLLIINLKGKSPSKKKSKKKSRILTRKKKTLRKNKISLQANAYKSYKNKNIFKKRNKKETKNSAL